MEVKINREIRDYSESMFFGLSMRQFFFSVAAVGIAIAIYFVLKPMLGLETVSWLCIIGAAPFATMGFVKYHGMTAEQFIWVWLRSELVEPKELKCETSVLYQELLEEAARDNRKGMDKCRSAFNWKRKGNRNGIKNTEEPSESGEGGIQNTDEGKGCYTH